MNTLTKSVVMVSTLVAAFVELYLASNGNERLWVLGLATFAAALVAGVWVRSAVLRVVLVAIYLAPAGWLLWIDAENYNFEIAWIMPVLALMLLGPGAWKWNLPQRWQLPIAMWALVVSVTWPIIALREMSFDPALLSARSAVTSGLGISPWFAVTWAIYMTLGHNVGLLWIDALYRWYARDPARFRSEVILPLGVAAALACVVGAYQGFVDLTFLNGHLWPHMKRAAGTLMDANGFGMVAAWWGPAFVALALGLRGAWSVPLAAAGFVLALTGVWTSGSRTALAALGLSTLGIAAYAWHHRPAAVAGSRPWYTRPVPIVLGVAAVAGVAVLIARGSSTTTVFDRIPSLVPGMEGTTMWSSIRDLWERFGYGPAAMRMIGDHPLQGVGVGAFHTLVYDYGTLVTDRQLVPDNAQNWYRHIVAELGLLGALGAFGWTLIAARALVFAPASTTGGAVAPLIRVALVGFGVISILGMPGQSVSSILTFWTFLFWYFSSIPADPRAMRPWPTAAWVAALVLVVAHAGLTYASARGDLLPQHRAQRFYWDYSYGISGLEPNRDGTPGRRWTSGKSLSTIRVQGRVLKFVGWIDHPDADEKPVHVRVVADGKPVFDGDLKRSAAIRIDIPAAPGARFMVIETDISRVWRPVDFGRSDRRVLGLAIQDWRWDN